VVWFGSGDCGQHKGTMRDVLMPQKQREGEECIRIKVCSEGRRIEIRGCYELNA
jgi:hypothetical protein